MSISQENPDFLAALEAGETIVTVVRIDGAHASKHPLPLSFSAPSVVVTNQRIIVFERRGVLKKRQVEEGSWRLSAFQMRSNTNQGTALGPFLYFLTLFTTDDETLSIAFKRAEDRDAFKAVIHEVLADAAAS